MTHVADKGFQNLSVTADMWIPIREVHVCHSSTHYVIVTEELQYFLVECHYESTILKYLKERIAYVVWSDKKLKHDC